MLAALLAISIMSGGVTLSSLFRAKDMREISECENGSTDPLTVNVCRNGVAVFKGTAVAIYIVTWLYLSCMWRISGGVFIDKIWLLDACIMVASYVGQLQEKVITKVMPNVKVMGMPIGNPEPLMMYNSVGAPGINNGYAFSHVPVDSDVQYSNIGTAV